MNYVSPIAAPEQEKVSRETRRYIQLAEDIYARRLPELSIVFNLKGRSSGMYRVWGKHREIRFNPWIFSAHFEHCMATTVPHEVAHFIVDSRFGLRNVRPHGREWKSVMAAFGADARVTADLSLTGIPLRRTRYFPYQCSCDSHELGVRRHRKVLWGEAQYRCRRCGSFLENRQ